MKRVWNNTREVYGVTLPLSLSGGRTIGKSPVLLEDDEAEDLMRKKLVIFTPPVRGNGHAAPPIEPPSKSRKQPKPRKESPSPSADQVEAGSEQPLVSLTRVRLLELCRERKVTPIGYTRLKKSDLVALLGE